MIKQPNVILGNSKLLVTMGRKGEIFGLFYPRRDTAQHAEESMGCIYTNGTLSWLDSIDWASRQNYIKDTNMVVTRLTQHGVKVTITDFVLPDAPVLVRRFSIRTKVPFRGKFYYYSKFNAGEMQHKNSNLYDPEHKMLIQYWQDHHIGIKGIPPFDEWQVGKATDVVWWTNAKKDMEDGKLQKNMEDIGNLNMAAGWDLELDEGESKEITIYIGLSDSRVLIHKFLHKISEKPVGDLLKKTKEHWHEWLNSTRATEGLTGRAEEFAKPYKRALLTLDLLSDRDEGSFIAAPEFDPGFEKCGGYGYCWNRDSAKIVLSLTSAGYPEYAKRFFKWCKKTQMPDGSWFQRYWLNGDIAPSWCNFRYSNQIDETAITLYAANEHYKTLNGIRKDLFLNEIWLFMLQGAEHLMSRTGSGLHDTCMDLWETYYGIFTYTNASIYAGLLAASHIALDRQEIGLSKRWQERAEFIKQQMLGRLWLDDGYFAKGIIDNHVDTTVDASILGCIIPFRLLDPAHGNELEMIRSVIRTIEARLSVSVNEHRGILRYENDHYIGGNPWLVLTLWLSKTLLYLAPYEAGANSTIERALEYIRWSLKGTTSPGLFPEQVDKHTGRPVWAIPLGWSNSLFIDNVLLLNTLDKDMQESN
ncbi:MAG: glucan 1,4-alpha-glucosidase [ANME-2 cluster archaeon]|nr:glucan 1,4-alpha-glucosidase [ANME-2 cluster archaeon]